MTHTIKLSVIFTLSCSLGSALALTPQEAPEISQEDISAELGQPDQIIAVLYQIIHAQLFSKNVAAHQALLQQEKMFTKSLEQYYEAVQGAQPIKKADIDAIITTMKNIRAIITKHKDTLVLEQIDKRHIPSVALQVICNIHLLQTILPLLTEDNAATLMKATNELVSHLNPLFEVA
jgi:hypothetical protein